MQLGGLGAIRISTELALLHMVGGRLYHGPIKSMLEQITDLVNDWIVACQL